MTIKVACPRIRWPDGFSWGTLAQGVVKAQWRKEEIIGWETQSVGEKPWEQGCYVLLSLVLKASSQRVLLSSTSPVKQAILSPSRSFSRNHQLLDPMARSGVQVAKAPREPKEAEPGARPPALPVMVNDPPVPALLWAVLSWWPCHNATAVWSVLLYHPPPTLGVCLPLWLLLLFLCLTVSHLSPVHFHYRWEGSSVKVEASRERIAASTVGTFWGKPCPLREDTWA